jgi:hypothetical protein
MGIPKPTGEYVDQMLEPDGWPELDEDTLQGRANEFRKALQQLTQALDGYQHERAEIFNGGIWSGGAANAANAKLGDIINELTGLQNDLVNAITWYGNARGLVEQTKTQITDAVDKAQQEINSLLNDSSLEDDERNNAIKQLVSTIHEANVSNVGNAAAQIPAFSTWKPPANALENLLNQKAPPAPGIAGQPKPVESGQQGKPGPKSSSQGPAGAKGVGTAPGTSTGTTSPNSPQHNGSGANAPAANTQAQPPGVTAVAARGAQAPKAAGAAPVAGPTAPAVPNATPQVPKGANPAPAAGPVAPVANSPMVESPQAPKGANVAPTAGPATPTPGGPPSAVPVRPVGQPAAPIAVPPNAPSSGIGGTPSIATGGGSGHGGGGGGPLSSALSNWGGGGDHSPGQQPTSSSPGDLGQQRPDAGQPPAAALGESLGKAIQTGAPLGAAAAASVPLAAAESAMISPAAAHGPALTPETPAAELSSTHTVSGGGHGGGGGGGGGGTSFGGGGSLPSMMSGSGMNAPSSGPLLPPATPPPAAPVAPGGGQPGQPGTPGTPPGQSGPGVHPASARDVGAGGFGGSMTSSHADAAPAPIPVSSARVEKDTVANATRRQSSGDPAQLAYRIAAALCARDVAHTGDFGFFWLTAVTADGQIVVANSYGVGYLPEEIHLPEQVIMASADNAVPLEERARWATYPNLALQGWAAHRDTTLRVVIGKEEHFKGIDPGAPEKYIQDDDIPDSGKMAGRSRLELIAPGDAARLAATSDWGLVELLPPAPVDATAPADQRNTLWFEVMKHLMSSDTGRGTGHLQALVAYANHAQQLALYRGHTGVHVVEQRAAVADWMYWRSMAALLDDALGGSRHP